MSIKRREFITLLGSAAAAWPLSARAQQPPAVPVIGFLDSGSAAERLPHVTAFRDSLKEVGFIEGANLHIEYRWAEFHYDRLPALAADLVRRPVAVIFTSGAVNSTLAAKAATQTIPIVFVLGSDPVAIGLVPRLNRPGGNVTGVTGLTREPEAKRLAVLHELIPTIRALGLLVNPNNLNTKSEVGEIQALADARGWRLLVVTAGTAAALDAAFETMAQQKVDAFAGTVDALFTDQRNQIAVLAARYALPGTSDPRAGGLISYGANLLDNFRQGGAYVGRILKGEKPGELPVKQPTKFELVINLKTAKALGLTVPPSLLTGADEVIE
jgi:putative ABC transport system substrate-binding protein